MNYSKTDNHNRYGPSSLTSSGRLRISGGEVFEKEFRSGIQHHQKVSYELNVFSREFLDKYQIQTASGVQRSIAVLMHRGLIDKQQGQFVFEDPFFSRWITGHSAGKQASW